MIRVAMLLTVAVAIPLHAQAGSAATRSPDAEVRELWTSVTAYLTRAAAAVPDSSYAYKPVATVRSFGQLIGHVAGSQRMFCAAALGEKIPPEDAVEKAGMSKTDLVKALDESNTYCTRAYALSGPRLAETVELFGQRHTKGFALAMNATHDNEHYGNVVTYMRMLGMVPPSSQPAP